MFDFPSSPSVGQQFTPYSGGPTYVWQPPVWRLASGGISTGVYVGESPPLSPVQGTLWFNSATGNSFIYFSDVDSSAWIQFNLAPPSAAWMLNEQVSAPATGADQGGLYTKDQNGRTELYYRRENSGAEMQMSYIGRIPGARQQVEYDIGTVGQYPWQFRGFPQNIVGFDLAVVNLVGPGTANQLYLQFVNSVGTLIGTNYRGSYMYSNGVPIITNAGYASLSPNIPTNCGAAGVIMCRKSGFSTNYWTWSSTLTMLGATQMMYAAGDCCAVALDNTLLGFNFGLTNAQTINGGNVRLEYW